MGARLAAVFLTLILGTALASDPEVSLQLGTRGGQTTFQIGEVIQLDLSFTAAAPNVYQLDMASYDRSGRLGEDTFLVTPDSGRDDPLALYYRSFSGFIGGGLRGMQMLSAEPVVIHRELNEWVRFQNPGEYRLTVKSSRASKLKSPGIGGLTVTSNEIRLTIIPATAEWQRQTLLAALATLDAAHKVEPVPSSSGPRREAFQMLRYLGSADAARELARRMNDPDCYVDCRFGLVGSPARDVALAEMKRLLADADFPVSADFLQTMSVLALPPDARINVPEERFRLESGFRQDLVAALPSKRGAALAMSAYTVAADASMRSTELPPDLRRTLTQALVSQFDRLPAERQSELLESRWSALDHQLMAPLVARIAQRYVDYAEPREMKAWWANNASSAALRHWYELDPAAARPAVLREISRPRPRFNAAELGMLPDRELPEIELGLVEHLREASQFEAQRNLASLIFRYAGAPAEGPVSAYLDQQLGKGACETQNPLLAYLLKTDPAAAKPRLEAAISARGRGFNACNHSLLQDVALLHNDPILEEIGEKALDDADPEIVSSAAAYLGQYGPASAETLLWEHLTSWSNSWRQKPEDLSAMRPGDNMIRALATGHNWITDEIGLRKLIQLAVSPGQKQQAEQYLRTWQARPWNIQCVGLSPARFLIGLYEEPTLEAAIEKLRQLPKGTELQWTGCSAPEQTGKAFPEIAKAAAAAGLILHPAKL